PSSLEPHLFPYTTLFRSPGIEHRRNLPRKQVAAPRDDPAEAVGLGAPRKRLRQDHRVDLLSPERLERRRHRLQGHDRHVLEAHADRKSTRLNSSHEWISY